MKLTRILAAAGMIVALASSMAFATPSTQIWIPSTDVKGYKDIHIDVDNYMRFSPKPDAGPNYYNLGLSAGVLPSENIKLEVGIDMLVTSLQGDNQADNHPFYFNAKLGTPEDAFGIKGLPAFAVGAYNLGTYDKPEVNGISTRQNIVYGLVGKTLPVVGRLSAGGYYGSSRALASAGNPSDTKNNSGFMASWDRSMPEISDKLWLAVDYMSGNNFNGEVSVGGSWTFSKNVSLIVGAVFFNPFYNVSAADNGLIPGGKPARRNPPGLSLRYRARPTRWNTKRFTPAIPQAPSVQIQPQCARTAGGTPEDGVPKSPCANHRREQATR